VGVSYQPEEIALFGATGLAGLPLSEVTPLVRASAQADGRFDPVLFGAAGLKAVSPILSFKILSNMPVCFVSICENLQGPNAIYTPWEGQGAQAIEAGVRAVRRGEAPCAVVGGCDAKTHELAFLRLEQLGVFESWKRTGAGPVPGEGAVFLVLEAGDRAARRGARCYARIAGSAFRSRVAGVGETETRAEVLRTLGGAESVRTVVSAEEAEPNHDQDPARVRSRGSLRPKPCVGNLFAAAAALQVALGAVLANQTGGRVLSECFGHGSEQAAFLLQAP
jgi:3-oxoacyl-(acyl-carrier-protein) synthase